MTEIATQTEPDDASPAIIRDVRRVELRGKIDAALGLSGIVLVDDFLVIGADEGHKLQILKRVIDADAWKFHHDAALAESDQEVDIQAITFGDGHLYVVGSHSSRRRLMKPDLSVRRNRERFVAIQSEKTRNRLYRLPFDSATGQLGKKHKIDLSKRFRNDPWLRPFCALPSKENGIDIEGLAYRDGQLFVGFRGPVLRENYVPVMVFDFDHPKSYRLRFVRLQGQGIRDMVALDNGLLIVSGPINDAPGPFCLWWWDGEDQIPGKDRKVGPTVRLGEVSTPGGARVEGLALLGSSGDAVEVMLVYETRTAAQAVRMWVDLPA